MAETSYPYRDQEITDAQYSDFARDYAPSGVIKRTAAGTDLQVTASSTGMEVTVAAGRANLRGHRYRNSAAKKLTIEEKSTYPRIDTVVVRSEYGSAKSARLVVKKGAPTVPPTAPVAPDIEQSEEGTWEEPLCDVPVSASTVTIAQSTLKDRRTLVTPASAPVVLQDSGFHWQDHQSEVGLARDGVLRPIRAFNYQATARGLYMIVASYNWRCAGGGAGLDSILVDGVNVSSPKRAHSRGSSAPMPTTLVVVVPLPSGSHSINLSASTDSASAAARIFSDFDIDIYPI